MLHEHEKCWVVNLDIKEKRMTEENKDDVVQYTPLRVVRFARPDARTPNSNLYGITFVFHLDYKTRLVRVQWSVCNGDNFNKHIGVQEALKRQSFYFPLDDVRNTGLVRALLFNLFEQKDIVDMLTEHYSILHQTFYKITQAITQGALKDVG